MEGEYYMEHGSVAHRGEKIHNMSAKIGPDFFHGYFPLFILTILEVRKILEAHGNILKWIRPRSKSIMNEMTLKRISAIHSILL